MTQKAKKYSDLIFNFFWVIFMEKIYAVAIVMSSPNRVLSSKETNEGMTLEVNYAFKKETRQRIAAIRTLYKKPMYKNCLEFFTLYLCKESQKAEIEAAVKDGATALQAIDSTLQAEVKFMQLDMEAVDLGEMYHSVVSAIEARVLGDIAEKIKVVAESKAGQLPKRSQEALLKMVERLENINVLGDKNITEKLTKIKEKIISGDLKALKDDMDNELTMLKGRGAFLEFQ